MPMTQRATPINLDDIIRGNKDDLDAREKQVTDHNNNWRELLMLGIPSVAIGAIDTIAQSVTPDSVVGEKTVEEMVDGLSAPLGQFYRENKEGVQTLGEIGSAFIPIIGASKLIRAEGLLDKALGNTKKGEMLRTFLISSGRTRKDFIDSIDQEAKLFVANKQLSLSENGTQALDKALKNAKFGAAADMFKESVAADLAIVGLYNESDMFFPDDFSATTNFALFAVPDVLLTGLAYRFTGTAIKKHLQSTYGKEFADLLNPLRDGTSQASKDAVTKSLSFPGRRGPTAALEGLSANIAQKDRVTQGNTAELATSGQQRLSAHQRNIMEQLVLMGEDDIFKHGITSKIEFSNSSPEMQNLLNMVQNDPSLIVGVRSIQKLDQKAQVALPAAIDKRIADIIAERAGLNIEIKLAEEGKAVADLKAKVAKSGLLKKELDAIKQVRSPIVAEIDGSITPLADRKWSILDEPEKLNAGIKTVKDGDTHVFTTTQQMANEVGAEIGVTDTGKVLLQPLKKELEGTALGGVNVTAVIAKHEASVEKEASETMKLLLKDMSQDWHFSSGRFGKPVFRSLSQELQTEVQKWTGSSGSSAIREWVKNGDPRYQELLHAYRQAGFQRRLSEVANPDGTITLFRGESKAETKNPTNDVVSMSTDVKKTRGSFAASSDKNLIKRNVPIEDIVMPIGGLGDEAEFIVKGNLRRNKSAAGVKQTLAIHAQSFEQRMLTYGLLQKALDSYVPGKTADVFVHGESNLLELDFAVQLMKKFSGQKVVFDVVGGKSVGANFNALQHKLIVKQFEEIQNLKSIQSGSKLGLLKLSKAQTLSNYDIPRMVNAPNPTVGGQHPLMEMLNEIMPRVGEEAKDLRNFYPDLNTVKAGMVKLTNEARLGEDLLADLKLTGSSLLHSNVENRAPSILLSTDNYMGRIGPDEMAERIMANKIWQNTVIEAQHAIPPEKRRAPIVSAITEALYGTPEAMALATKPDLIFEGTAVNRGIAGQQSEVFNTNPVLQTMDRLRDMAEKVALTQTTKVFDAHTATFNKLLTNNNVASLDTFNIAVNSLQHGWKLKAEPVNLGDGLWGFALDDKWAFNKEQYQNLFNKSFDEIMDLEGQVLMPVRASVKKGSDQIPQPVAVDNLALDGMAAVQDIEHKWLDNFNFLRELQQQPPVEKKNWHIPAINLQEGYTVYLADGSGRLQNFVNRPTKAEAIRTAQQEVDKAGKDGLTWIMRSEDEVQQYFDVQGDIWAQARNFSYAEFQTGSSKGKLGTSTIQFGKAPLDGLLRRMQKNYEVLTRRTFATVFESELRYSETRIQADTLGDELLRRSKSTLQQQYQRTILGRSALTPQAPVGKLYYAVETVADDFLRLAWDKIHAVKKPTAASVSSDFDTIQNKLGSYNPFKTIEDMLENSGNVKVPPTFRSFTTKLNGFTTDMVLRIMDMGMPIINFASLVSVMPAVTAALHRGPNESYDSWVARIGIIGSPIDDSNAVPNTSRMVQEGLSMFFDPEMQKVRQLARDRGYIKQEVAERLNLWTSPHQGWLGRNRDKIIDTLSTPTDWSETMSRDISFGMMFKIGRKTFGLQDEQAMLFAHTHANKIIGDFRPTNRPQMFQGAAGMPMGLFTTWAINWLQRVFGDIEAGRMGATFWQVGMQQFLFGAQSFPGVETAMDTYMTSYDGKRNVMDSMDAMYGRTATDTFFQGTLATLTGVAFQSRANVSLPAIMSGESPMTAIPSLSVMNTLYQGLSEGFKSIKQNGGFNPREMSEIISVYGVNGAMRNLFQTLNDSAVDRHGALINDSIRSWESAIPRLMELKSVRETRKAQELNRDRMQREIQRSHIERLSKQLRTAARGNAIDTELMESALMDYYLAGGNPADFKRYLREQVLASSFEKSSRLLLQALRASDEKGLAMRLMAVGADDGMPSGVFK